MKKAILFSGLQAQNTFIGGIGATINTASLLAALLGISVSRISNFEVIGSEARSTIFGGYMIRNGAFQVTNNNNISYYKDSGLVTSLGQGVFHANGADILIKKIKFDNCLQVDSYCFYRLNKPSLIEKILLKNCTTFIGVDMFRELINLKVLYIPLATTFGDSVGNNNFFNGTNCSNLKIYANPFLATNNGGNPDGDLAIAISQGADVRYVTNFDKPSTPTFTLTGGIYGTAIQINDIVCTGTNAIDYFEVWINGQDSGRTIKASSELLTNLIVNTSYDIQLVARDIFYNESEISSKKTASTKSTYYSNDSDANTYITASAFSNPTDLESTNYLFSELKTAGLYSKIQAGWLFKGATASNQKFNIKNPVDTDAGFRLVFSGTGTYSSLGFQTNGSNAYADTKFKPSVNQSVNSNGLTIVIGTNNAVNGSFTFHGCQNSSTQETLITEKRDNTNFGKRAILNSDSSSINITGENEARGVLTALRRSTNVGKLIKNGVVIGSSTASGTLPNLNVFLGSYNYIGNPTTYSTQRIQMAFIHEGLTDAEVTTLHNIINVSETLAGRKTW